MGPFKSFSILLLLLHSYSARATFYLPSVPLSANPHCTAAFASDHPAFRPLTVQFKPDKLYDQVSKSRWALDDNGSTYRHVELRESHSRDFIIEQYRPALDIGPSKMWIQTLQSLGQLPRDLNVLAQDPRGLRWSDIESFMAKSSLFEYQHPMRETYLQSHRGQYLNRIQPGYEFTMSQYPRRKWYTPEFRKGADQALFKTLRNANYIFVRDKATGKFEASMRLVRVHNGLLRLKHVRTGRTLEILGDAEFTWGANGEFSLGKEMLESAYQLDRFVREFLKSTDSLVKRDSNFEPIEMIRLPMELGLGVDLPRDYTFMDLSTQKDFRDGNFITVGGEKFEVSYGHAVLIEPGLFAIEKSKRRMKVFIELSIWLGHSLATPSLPQWVNERKTAHWTYNDLPLYKIFGFNEDTSIAPIHKFGVNWAIYKASVSEIFPALRSLAETRDDGGERAEKLQYFLSDMENKGL